MKILAFTDLHGDEVALNKIINKAQKEWKKHEAIEEKIRKKNIPIKTQYDDGTLLEGRIIEATDGYIKVRLEKPGIGIRF